MKLNKQILLYSIIFIVSYLLFYKFFNTKAYDISNRDILVLDEDLWEDKRKVYTVAKWYDYIWLQKKSKNDDTKAKTQHQDLQDKVSKIYIKKHNIICIEDKCMRFLAVVKKNGVSYVSFYDKSFPNNHIKLFKVNEVLYKKLFIKSILDNMVILSESNNTQEWKFFFFDVNRTKYKPKDKNAIHL